MSAEDNNIKVLCTLCAGGSNILSTSKNSTSNFKNRLESPNGTVKLVENANQKAATQQKMELGGGANPKPIRKKELKRLFGRDGVDEILKYSSSIQWICPCLMSSWHN